MNKLKTLLHTSSSPAGLGSVSRTSSQHRKANRANNNERVEPEVGFKLVLDPGSCTSYENDDESESANNNQPSAAGVSASGASTSVPELQVHLVGARHLPVSFGLKSVEGYMIKIKLFPGAAKFDSSIQTTSCPGGSSKRANTVNTTKFPLNSFSGNVAAGFSFDWFFFTRKEDL